MQRSRGISRKTGVRFVEGKRESGEKRSGAEAWLGGVGGPSPGSWALTGAEKWVEETLTTLGTTCKLHQ